MEQKRFFLAILISAIILFGWSYFFQQPPQKQANSQQATQYVQTPSPSASPLQDTSNSQPINVQPISNAPHRIITVSSPLYEVKLDSMGGVATSWILKASKDTENPQDIGKPLYSGQNYGRTKQPLQLIPAPDLLAKTQSKPLAIVTSDANLNMLLSASNYSVENVGEGQGDASITLQDNQNTQIDFLLRDENNKVEATKTFVFKSNSYIVDVKTKILRDGQPVSDAKLAIGPSIGDQGIEHYNFYSIAPEVTAITMDDSLHRFTGAEVHGNKNSPDYQKLNGNLSWAGIGDTYFAMVAVSSTPQDGFELRATRYEHEVDSKKEERFLLAGFVPIKADGALTSIYVGPKDHYLLKNASAKITQEIGGNRQIDLERLINYGWLKVISRPLSTPILSVIKFIENLTGNYGVAIIIFTFIVYMLFFPLKYRASASMKRAQKYQPRMKEIQEKLKTLKSDDPRARELQMEQLRLMKESNMLGGCLPMLIQIPFFIAIYYAISVSIDFRQARFLWIPDLSAAEPYTIHILPLLMAGSMLVLQLITPAPSADPLQKRMMAVMLPAMMLYFLWNAPAGLLIYWFVGNLVGFGQQMLINRMIKTPEDDQTSGVSESKAVGNSKKMKAARV
jgi:YidC/Oxa1 family membrane protein insertase